MTLGPPLPGRRDLLFGGLALGFGSVGLAALTACGKPRTTHTSVHGGVDFTKLVPRSPDTTLPLVVAIHGEGGAPEHWIDGWASFPGRAEIALPRGIERRGDGFAWFVSETDMKSEKLAADVAAAEERLWKGIADLAASRRIVVAGYSQGAVLAFVMAARHAGPVAGAFAVAGACPAALLPKDKSRAAPLVAYHGTADDVFAVQLARDAIKAFEQQGNEARLREYAGVSHAPTDALHADLRADMQKVLSPK